MSGYLQKPGSGGGGVESLNALTGALNLVEGAGIDITTAGSDITIAAIGANVSNDTSLAVKVSTTAALPGTPTYNNGTAGVGATLTRSSNGTTGTIDGVTAANLMVGDYILVKNQAAQLQNGVYSVTQQGSASLPYILTRVAEADTTAELDDLVVTAASGTTNKGVPFGQQTNNPVIGTDNIVFTATGIYMRQQTSGTQAVNQIPVYTGTALTQTKGTANFKYNPTNDLFTIRGIDYTFPANNGDASQVLTTDGSGTLSWTTPSGGSPAGSNNQIQINQSGSFFADNKFQKSDTGFNVGLNHTSQSAVTFTGSGLDDLTLLGKFSGTVPTTYTVTIDGVNQKIFRINTDTITGGSFSIGDTITSGSKTAIILGISVNPYDNATYLTVNVTIGSFSNGNVIHNGYGVTAKINTVQIGDTFSINDGVTTLPYTVQYLQNGILVALDTPTGHTLSDSWTWTYSTVNQNVLDFSNNDYKFQSTFVTDTYGYQISDNFFGAGFKGSANIWTNIAGDLGFTGILNIYQPQIIDKLTFADGGGTTQSFLKNQYYVEVSNGTELSTIGMTPTTFDIQSYLSSGQYGISQSAGTVTLGSLSGGNGTGITIDDANEQITIGNIKAYDDDTAAGTAGLTAGMLYMTTGSGAAPLNVAGILMIKQ